MPQMERLNQRPTVLAKETPQLPVTPIPRHARHHHGGFYGCRFCRKLYTDVASIRRH
jgi:hypothetical protein